MKRASLLACAAACLSLFAAAASAESTRNLDYPYGWVYGSAVRLLKVDLGCKIDEQDKEAGYILFWYEQGGVKSYATLETVDLTGDENGYEVHVRLVLEKFPTWVEEYIIDKLEKKVESQYGAPPEYKKKKKKKEEEEKEHEKDGDGKPDDGKKKSS